MTTEIDDLQQGNQSVPNATAVLVLGIVSIVTCFCYGIIGLACAIIALVLEESASSTLLGFKLKVSVQTSHQTAVAPNSAITSALAA